MAHMLRFLALMGALAASGTAMAIETSTGAPQSLEICVLPYINMQGLLIAYGPLATYLEKELNRPVKIVSARDYPTLLQQTAQRAYPILITASHFARLAQVDSGYTPILRPITNFHELILVRKESPIQSFADLKSKSISIPDILAQVRMIFAVSLRAIGMDPLHDVIFISSGSHKNAAYATHNRDTDAALVSEGAYRHMSDDIKSDLRVISPPHTLSNRESIPVVYLTSPTLSPQTAQHIATRIESFANHVPEGIAWINSLKYGGLRPPTQDEMTAMDEQVNELRRVVNSVAQR
ncbi:phosphonate transport system substrate-binding protein [Azospirillaceae bacterium]